MNDLAARIRDAEALWREGDAALAAQDREAAYRLYTQAHDLTLDCPRLHEQAHRYLRQVTRHHRNPLEYFTDTLLVFLAPLGVFEAIAWAQKSSVRRMTGCVRQPA
jgi:hypothetical protein